MRKISKEKKRYLLRHRFVLERHELERKLLRKRNRFNKLPEKIIRRRQVKGRKNGRQGKYHKQIIPPSNFSLINNTEEVLQYFEDNGNFLKQGYSVRFDLLTVKNLTFDALAFLMTKINNEEYMKGCIISGNAPKKPELQKLFIESGFYEHVNSSMGIVTNHGKMFPNFSKKKVDTTIGANAAKSIIKHVFGDLKYQELSPIFVECMSNTHNHAGEKYNWWLFYYNVPGSKISKIGFIDLGVGIFGSLNSRIKNLTAPIWKQFNNESNKEKLMQILEGKVKIPTRTKEKKRGKGLPAMWKFSQREEVKNVTIISNDVYGNLDTGEFRTLSKDFNGTFIYWEMHNL